MKILLTAINAKYIHSNLAVYSLRAYAQKYAENQAPEIQIKEYTINQPVDEILMDLYGEHPDVICLSCYLWNITYVEMLLEELPKVLPDTRLWLGGPEVSYNAPQMLGEYPMVEGIMCGEGEETFLELTEYFRGQGKRLEEIRGIAFRMLSGSVKVNAARKVLDLSTVPFVYEDLENFQNRIIYYESSRGCPFSCSYCLSSVDKTLRFREIELVKRELQFFIDHEVPQVKFVDRTFNCRHDHAMAVWSYIREHDRGKTNFHFEIAADLLNEEEIRLINSMRPGLIQLEIGVQSTNERTIREIRRSMKTEQVKETVARIRGGGNVHQHLDLIAGLPYEDYASFAASFNEVYSMRPEQLQLGFLKVLKGSLMQEKTGEYELFYQDRPPYEVLSTRWLSYGDIIRLKKVEEMVEVYYNSAQFANTMRELEKEFDSPFEMYEAMGRYYEENGLFGVSHSRISRYEILYRFICGLDEKDPEEYRGWLTLDLYLRDNVRNRPGFLGENRVKKEEAAAFYKMEAQEHFYLRGYEGYDSRQIRKMTHLERFRGKLLLFDYRHRDPLNSDAAVQDVTGWRSVTGWEP